MNIVPPQNKQIIDLTLQKLPSLNPHHWIYSYGKTKTFTTFTNNAPLHVIVDNYSCEALVVWMTPVMTYHSLSTTSDLSSAGLATSSSTSLDIVRSITSSPSISRVVAGKLSRQLHVPGLVDKNVISHFQFPFLHFRFLFLDQPHVLHGVCRCLRL